MGKSFKTLVQQTEILRDRGLILDIDDVASVLYKKTITTYQGMRAHFKSHPIPVSFISPRHNPQQNF